MIPSISPASLPIIRKVKVQPSRPKAFCRRSMAFLATVGTNKTKLLSANIWITDMANFAEMNAVWDAWVSPGNTPARATVEASLHRPTTRSRSWSWRRASSGSPVQRVGKSKSAARSQMTAGKPARRSAEQMLNELKRMEPRPRLRLASVKSVPAQSTLSRSHISIREISVSWHQAHNQFIEASLIVCANKTATSLSRS